MAIAMNPIKKIFGKMPALEKTQSSLQSPDMLKTLRGHNTMTPTHVKDMMVHRTKAAGGDTSNPVLSSGKQRGYELFNKQSIRASSADSSLGATLTGIDM